MCEKALYCNRSVRRDAMTVPATAPDWRGRVFAAARYERSVHDWIDLPPDQGIEIAFAGRSNAGKSSALNALTGRTRLAFVSKTPGRTQQINFFALGDDRYLVDLPGYGYAGVPLTLREHWGELLSRYVGTRHALRALVVIMDARRPLTPLDQQMLAWFAPTDKPVRVLLAKADKLSRAQANASLATAEKYVLTHRINCSVQLFSSTARVGVEAALDWLIEQMEITAPKTKTPG